MTATRSGYFSCFELLSEQFGSALPAVRFAKATLTQLSHMLEEVVILHQLPALVFAGFQEAVFWLEEESRYEELVKVARHVFVFAGKPLPPSQHSSETRLPLEYDDPLRQEWLLTILSPSFSVVLCAREQPADIAEETLRQFDTLWSFEPAVVSAMLDLLQRAVADRQPHSVEFIRQARLVCPLTAPDAGLITRFSREILRYEEDLHMRLAHREEQFKQVVASIPHCVYASEFGDDAFRNVYISPNIERLSGYSPGIFLNDADFWTSLIHPDDMAADLRFETALKSGRDSVVEYRIRRADGQWVWVRNNARVEVDPLLHGVMIYGALEDITDKRSAEQALLEREKLLTALEKERELNAVRARLMTTISHEFRTPLATILSSSELLERHFDQMDKERRLRRLATIREQVEHLRAMLSDIQLTLHSEDEAFSGRPVEVNLRQLCQDVLAEARAADRSEHSFVFNHPETVVDVLTHPLLIRRVLAILLSNAVNYSPPHSQVLLELTVSDDAITFCVADQGTGVLQSEAERIYEPLYRGANAGSVRGMGLGLAIASDFVAAVGGSLSHTSEPEKGSAFVVRLPL